MTDSVIIDKVLDQIIADVNNGDLTALEELLINLKERDKCVNPNWTNTDYLVGYLSED